MPEFVFDSDRALFDFFAFMIVYASIAVRFCVITLFLGG